MKKFRAISVIMSVLMVCSSLLFVGCNKGGPSVDSTKSQLRILNFGGGIGEEWLDNRIAEFEELHKNDTHWEEGKVGVQIHPMHKKVTGTELVDTLSGNSNDLFFTEGVNYYDFVNRGDGESLFADITDIVTSTLPNESKSIEQKMSGNIADYFKTNDGKYYAVPFYAGFEGLNYDIDLFDEYGLFFVGDENNNYRAKYVIEDDEKIYSFCKLNGNLSSGPNGIHGDYDDGLPATYEEFFALCEYMKSGNSGTEITPMIMNSAHFYMHYLLASMQADYEGVDDYMLNFTFNGTANHLVEEINADGSVVLKDPVSISNANGYELYGQAGRYYALSFLETCFKKGYISNTEEEYMSTMNLFLNGKYSSKIETIGMIVEGCWWANEADNANYFNNGKGRTRDNSRLGYLPFPKATDEQVGEKLTIPAINNTAIFIKNSSNDVAKAIAKEFIKFVLSDTNLKKFTQETDILMLYDYEMSEQELNNVSPYGRSVYEMKNNANIVYPNSKSPLLLSDTTYFNIQLNNWVSTVSQDSKNVTVNDPVIQFKSNKVNVKDYFFGLRDYRISNWATKFKDFID